VGRHTEDSIKKYIMRWGTNKDEFVEWSFLQDGEVFPINENTFVLPDALEYNIDISEEDLNNPSDFFSCTYFQILQVSFGHL